MQYRQDNTQRQLQTQKIAPHLIQANTLLQCSNVELLQVIALEQQENPALDHSEDILEVNGGCGHCTKDGLCVSCPYRRNDHLLEESSHERAEADTPAAEHYAMLAGAGEDRSADEREAVHAENDLTRIETDGAVSQGIESEFDPLMLARARTTLADHLLMHLRATSENPNDLRIAEYLVDALDENGYLQIDLNEACAVLKLPCSLIEEGIKRLQACDPPGVGARDLRECLLLQIRHLHEEDPESYDPITERLIRDYWDPFVQHRHGYLERRLGLAHGQVDKSLHFVQQQLSPRPAAQFRQPWDHRPDTQSAAIRPDVIIKRAPIGFEVEIAGFENVSLQINPYYRTLYNSIREARANGVPARVTTGSQNPVRLTPDHEKHIIAYVERANLFLKNLQQRRRTIQKITRVLIECQQGFLETGNRSFLRPLTRTRVAQQAAMHESTISRALLHKYVQLPSQEVVPFDVFFENAVSAKDTVAMLIAEEDPISPLSDQAIAEALKDRGIEVARRTVLKYREELRIPASYLRRRR